MQLQPVNKAIQHQQKEKALIEWKTLPEQSYKAIQVISFDDVIKAESPSLAKMKKEYGDIHTKAILTIIIVDVIKFFNVGKSMSDVQVGQTIELIQQEYWMLKPEDFKLCFNNAKKGMYGQVYDRIDGQVIMSWLQQHIAKRFEFSEQQSMQKHDRLKKETETMRQQQLQSDKEKHQEIQRIAVQQYINNQKNNEENQNRQ